MGPTRLNHAVLYVRDAHASAAFYQDHLDFQLVHDSPHAVFLRCAGSPNDHDLGLFSVGPEAADSAAGGGAAPMVGTYHLAWEVSTLGELAALRRRLVAADALVGESDHGTSKSLYGRDVDGLEFELLWAPPPEHLGAADHALHTQPLDLDGDIERFGSGLVGRRTHQTPRARPDPTEEPKTRFDVADIDPTDSYKLTTGLIVPRPIGWIATVSSTGVPNLAPYSFFNAVCGAPPTFVFAPAKAARRDTLENCRTTGEFTVNIVSEETAAAMNATAASVDADVDEIALAGLTAQPARTMTAPIIAEAKANFECRVTNIVDVGAAGSGNVVVFGEATMIHVADRLLDGTRVDQRALAPVGRHAGSWYSHADDLFEIERPA